MKTLVFTLGMAALYFSTVAQNSGKEIDSRQLDELNRSISKDAGNLSLYFARAEVYDALNNFENANNDYRKVLDLYQRKPDSKFTGEYAKSCYRLADDYFFRTSNNEKALKYVTKGLEVAREFRELEILEAILLGLDPAKRGLAFEKYQIVSAKYPSDIRLSMYRAQFIQNENPLGAAALYEKVIAADPFNKKALLSLGTIYNNEATKLSEQVISDPGTVYDYAKKAAYCFEKLYKLNPSDKELAHVLYRLYDETNERDKAKQLEVNTPY